MTLSCAAVERPFMRAARLALANPSAPSRLQRIVAMQVPMLRTELAGGFSRTAKELDPMIELPFIAVHEPVGDRRI
jgi:hypothetical protein